jgi:TatD DNase family protein
VILVDTHCHLNLTNFSLDLPEVIGRARDKGVERILVPGTNLENCYKALELSNRFTGIFSAVGIHPNEVDQWSDRMLYSLENLAGDKKTIAIGEIGLDYFRNKTPIENQIRILRMQLAVAKKFLLPVILHSRNALQDLWPIIRQWHGVLKDEHNLLAERPGILHAFEGNFEEAKEAASLNFLIGIGGPVTYKNGITKQQLATGLPLKNMVLETDAPFLSPSPEMGKRNEPANVIYIAEKIATLKNIEINIIADATTKNSDHMLLWSNN